MSQIGTRTPRRYCKRSHRQRAYEAERLGLPMRRDRVAAVQPVVPAPIARGGEQAALFLAEVVERTSVDVHQAPEQEAAGEDFELAPPLPRGAPDWDERLAYWEGRPSRPPRMDGA
ncbi:hypothetical protein [Streptomyces sp. ADI95-16]|uniref:hypothetical protein n=1 Tax=Streptomyces sp. ADI95-16 TaxID=1522758 RepID=UPI000F3AA580|nr:hypothetical protein [Streptomyces sp. ADI95-16]